jgi:hypothetical protein
VAYLDGEIIDASSRLRHERLRRICWRMMIPRALLQYACFEPCDLSLLLFELGPQFLSMAYCKSESESIWGIGRSVSGNVMIFWIDVRTKFVKA